MAPFVPGLAAGDVGEAADPRQDLAELVRPLPGDGPGADAAAADAGDGAALGVVAELHRLLDLGQDLLEQEPGVPVGERVVLDAALAAAVLAGPVPGLMKTATVTGISPLAIRLSKTVGTKPVYPPPS